MGLTLENWTPFQSIMLGFLTSSRGRGGEERGREKDWGKLKALWAPSHILQALPGACQAILGPKIQALLNDPDLARFSASQGASERLEGSTSSGLRCQDPGLLASTSQSTFISSV